MIRTIFRTVSNIVVLIIFAAVIIYAVTGGFSSGADDDVKPVVSPTGTTENTPETKVNEGNNDDGVIEIPSNSIIPKPEETIPTIPEPEETMHPISGMTELEMLACVIYQEAGGNSFCDDCRRYVGDVVLNRVNDPRFPDTMYEVLTSYRQYGRFYWTGIVWPKRAENKGEAKAVERAYRIAEELLNGEHSKLYGEGYIWQAEFEQGKSGFWCCGHYYGKN